MESSTPESKQYRVPILLVSVAAITFAAYLPSLHNEFLNWDDNTYIVKNPHMRPLDFTFLKWAFATFYFSNWHPLTWISYAIDYSLWGLNPVGYHLTNIVLHVLNTVLVTLLATRLLNMSRKTNSGNTVADKGVLTAAVLTGALFGLHPIHVESVAWVSERKDVLYAFFYLLSLLNYLRYANGKWSTIAETPLSRMSNRYYLLALLSFICSLLSKPMAVTLPLVLIILDRYPLKRFEGEEIRYVILEKVPFLLLALASSAITFWAQRVGGSMQSFAELPLSPRLLTATRSLVTYLLKMLFPTKLSPFYPYPKNVMTATLFSVEYCIPFLIAIGITTTCIFLLKRKPIWAVAWAYYVVTLVPVLGIIQVGEQATADRYTYLPGLGLFLLVAVGIEKLANSWLIKGRPGLGGNALSLSLAISLIASLSFATVKQILIWKNDESLWSKVATVYPEVAIAYNNRGVYYRDHGQFDKAIDDFGRGLTIAPDNYLLYTNRASAYVKLGRSEDALRDASKAVDLNPRTWKTYSIRGKAYSMRGQHNEALKDYSMALQLDPTLAELYNSRANIYVKVGLLSQAIDDYTLAIKWSTVPRGEYYYNRGVVYMMMGRPEDAAKDFTASRYLLNSRSRKSG